MAERTVGELAVMFEGFQQQLDRRFNDMNTQVKEMKLSLEHRLDSIQFVSRDVYEVEKANMKAEIDELKSAKQWFARGFVTSLVWPVVVALILAAVITR